MHSWARCPRRPVRNGGDVGGEGHAARRLPQPSAGPGGDRGDETNEPPVPRRQGRPKLRYLTVFLLKEGIGTYDAALKSADGLRDYNLQRTLSFQGRLYLRPPTTKVPSWVAFVRAGTSHDLGHLRNASTSAVLLLTIRQRLFALTFGYGRFLLKPECFEPDFGLRVVLNSVDPDKLRTVDVQTIEELTVHTKRQTSRSSSLPTFGLDVTRDLLRGVVGQPRDPNLASRLAGSDALAIATRIEFGDLGRKCETILRRFKDDTYKDRFGWIDHMGAVRDPERIREFDGLMLQAIRARDTSAAHLAVPEVLDVARLAGFKYSGQGRGAEPLPDVDLDDYLHIVADDLPGITVDDLRQAHVRAIDAASDQVADQWSVYRCLVFERRVGDRLLVLSGGQWFEVSTSFVRSVDRYVGTMRRSRLRLTPARTGEDEADYNARAAADLPGAVLLDRKLVRCDGAASDIEVCDILTQRGEFVHIKRRTRSATLSHLFSQGTVSAEAFLREESFRLKAREIVRRLNAGAARLVPKDRPKTQNYEVVYAIIADPARELPFFSRLHLMQSTQRLADLGYRFSLLRVPET